MPIIAESNPTTHYEPIPAGTYLARCYSMIHMGTNIEDIMGEKKELNKVRITWELPTEMKIFNEEKGEQPCVISKEFTLSMHEKATLRKYLESWRGRGFTEDEARAFDITVLLGKACMLSIIHKVSKSLKTYAEITSVSAIPKGMNCPPAINPEMEFSVLNFDAVKYESFPDFIKDKIRSSKEYRALQSAVVETPPANTEPEDGLPF